MTLSNLPLLTLLEWLELEQIIQLPSSLYYSVGLWNNTLILCSYANVTYKQSSIFSCAQKHRTGKTHWQDNVWLTTSAL